MLDAIYAQCRYVNAVVPIVVAPSRFICSFVGNFSNYFPIAFLINIGGLKKKKKF